MDAAENIWAVIMGVLLSVNNIIVVIALLFNNTLVSQRVIFPECSFLW